mgnify:FL=1
MCINFILIVQMLKESCKPLILIGQKFYTNRANVKVIVQTLNINRAKIFILIVHTLKTYVHLYIPLFYNGDTGNF